VNDAAECDLWVAGVRVSEFLVPLATRDGWSEAFRCAVRHLAVAASQLARDEKLPRDAVERFAAAEALFRAQSSDLGGISPQPIVPGPLLRLSGEETISLTALFANICQHDRSWLPHRSIDPELVHGAREILCALKWLLPCELQGSRA
jgi:hypothetical protein